MGPNKEGSCVPAIHIVTVIAERSSPHGLHRWVGPGISRRADWISRADQYPERTP